MPQRTLNETIKHSAHGQDFSIEVWSEDDCLAVYSFVEYGNERKAVSPRYLASYEVAYDYFQSNRAPISAHLIAIAKSDLDQQVYIEVSQGTIQEPVRIRANLIGRPPA